jgi:hypothetical protein
MAGGPISPFRQIQPFVFADVSRNAGRMGKPQSHQPGKGEMSEFSVSVGQALCTIATAGGGSAQCYNTAAMQTLGSCALLAVVLIAAGYRAMSRS